MGQIVKKSKSPLAILNMEKTMVTKVISELKSVSRLKIFPESSPIYVQTFYRTQEHELNISMSHKVIDDSSVFSALLWSCQLKY